MCQYLAKIESYDPVVVPLWWQYNFGVVHFTEHVRWNPPYGNNGTTGHGYSLSPDRIEQYSIRLEKRFCVCISCCARNELSIFHHSKVQHNWESWKIWVTGTRGKLGLMWELLGLREFRFEGNRRSKAEWRIWLEFLGFADCDRMRIACLGAGL